MQLYTNKFGEWERITKYPQEIEKFKAILKEELPMSFASENPVPVVMTMSPRYMVKFPRFVANKVDDGQVGQVTAGPPSATIPYLEKTVEDGFSVEWRITGRAPKVTEKGIIWDREGSRYRFAKTKAFDPQNDLELIIFLYFFSREVVNNYRKDNVENQNGRFQILKADVAAAIEFEKLKKDSRINQLIVDDATRMSYDELKKAAAIMRIAFSGIEKGDRVIMFNELQKPKVFEQFIRILDDVREKKKNPHDLSQINEKVKAAVDKKVIREIDGVWHITSTEGDIQAVIVKAEGLKPKDKMFALLEHLKTDVSALEKINEVMNAVPA